MFSTSATPKAKKVLMQALLLTILTSSAAAGSLSGDRGDERRKIFFRGNCGDGFERYVDASGHSAFASTPSGWGVQSTICAWAINAPSQKAAEQRALKSCKAGLEKYKVRAVKICEIIASK